MLREDLLWFFPGTAEEAYRILENEEGAAFHAGGTAILRVKASSVKALIDLSGAGLSYLESSGSALRIGACTTYGRFVSSRPDSETAVFLGRAVGAAATTPLRNRITFGGSTADRPVWTDLWPSLLCLGAKIALLGGDAVEMEAADYLASGMMKKPHLVKEIVLPARKVRGFTRRGVLTEVDYPAFSLAVSAEPAGRILRNVKIAVSGTTSVVTEEKAAAESFEGKGLSPDTIARCTDLLVSKFADDLRFTGAYKIHWLKTVLADGLHSLAEAVK